MAKELGSWSGMRKYLESDMLASTLKGRIRYSCTTFVGMDGCGIFGIFVDDKSIKQFSAETVASDSYSKTKPVNMTEYWQAYWHEKNNVPLENRREFDDEEFADALTKYRSLDIFEAIYSDNPMIRMFAILDRHLGKRSLRQLIDKIDSQPVWLRYFYRLRMSAENIDCM